MLKILAPARIHMTLIDLGEAGYRRNGGIGFCINLPGAEFDFAKHTTVDISELKNAGFSQHEILELTQKITKILVSNGSYQGIKLTKCKISNRHIGVGTGTTTALACIEAAAVLNEIQIDIKSLIKSSGRGGTSGIGVHTYFNGGFLLDAGRPFDAAPILPSDDIASPTSVPLVLSNIDMPAWPIGLFFPPDCSAVSRNTESTLFKNALPLGDEDVSKIAYHSVFGALTAVADSNFQSFCISVNALQSCAWKQHEINLHAPLVPFYMESLKELGCDAVGMSSVGPLIYFFASDFTNVASRISEKYPDAHVIKTMPNNTGRTMSHV
ncbi:beta-ribofuranosylaminobenzene 5'-phosphate synthase family protein [Herminiimonas aquatilis]|uniref:Beta-ribofuranosylaminobenzene 5'-phosphate synthase family protein n=1 Tax=Herminiimonas aquatilis TaxID=345342 RepID=A0ABW2J4C9_9BURK